jgi:peptidoglycan/LPS O-acetylase OafA/YrhL
MANPAPEVKGDRPSNDAAHSYLPGLDGLRAIAIGAVLLCHSFEFNGTPSILATAAGRLGTAGVHLFFAISGYLITSRLAAELAVYRPMAALRAFYLRRVFRIVPPLIPFFAILIACSWMGLLAVRSGEVLAAILFYSNYIHGKSWYTAHFWSLSAEEHFYLLWAPILALAGFRRSQVTMVMVIIITIITRPLLMAHSSLDPSRTLEQTHLQLDFFGYASLFALWMRFPKFRFWVRRLATHLVLTVVVALLGATAVHVRGVDLRTLQAFLFGALVLLLSTNPKLAATRALENPLLSWVGRRSYGIYVWQQIIFVPAVAAFPQQCVLIPLHTAIVLAIASVSYRFLELPLLKMAQGWSRQILSGNAPFVSHRRPLDCE